MCGECKWPFCHLPASPCVITIHCQQLCICPQLQWKLVQVYSVHAVQVTATHLSPRPTVDFCGCHPKVRSKRLKCVPVKLVWTQAHHLEDQQEVSACGHVHYLKWPLVCVEDVSEAPSSSLALPFLFVPSPATRGVWPWSRRAVGRGAQHSWCGCAAEGVPQGHARPSSDKGALHGLH